MQLNLNHLKKAKKIALAVSGGPDSIAMLYLMNEQITHQKLVTLSVDHHLRDESRSECEYVSEISSKLGLEHHILDWKHGGINSNIHDQARKARYGLMTDFCHANQIDALCTAHHADDRIENFFIRIYQGAGLFGLIDKDHIVYNEIDVVRPLFHLRKTDLTQYLHNRQIKYYEDKSNQDPKYLRSNIRNWLAKMPEALDPELFAKRVISVKNNLERSSKLVKKIFDQEIDSFVNIYDTGCSIITAISEDREIAYLVLSKVLNLIGNSDELIRIKSLENLYNQMQKKIAKSTLGGCVIQHSLETGEWVIYREFGKTPPKDLVLEDGAIWDDRYKVVYNKLDPELDSGSRKRIIDKTDDTLSISYLKEKEYVEIKKDLCLTKFLQKNKEIIFTLPIIRNLEKVIAIPHINYYDDDYDNLREIVKFEFIRKKDE